MQIISEFAHDHYYFTSDEEFVTLLKKLEKESGLSLHAEVEGEEVDGFLTKSGTEEHCISIYDSVKLTKKQKEYLSKYAKI